MLFWQTVKPQWRELPSLGKPPLASRRAVKYFLPLFVVAIVVVLGAAWMLYRAEVGELEQERIVRQQNAVDSARTAVGARLDSVFRDAIFLSSSEPMTSVLAQSDHRALDKLSEAWLAFARTHGIYRVISWIDEAGVERVRVATRDAVAVAAKPHGSGGQPYLAGVNGLARSELFVWPFAMTDDDGGAPETVVRIATPVFDGAQARRGAVVIEYVARDLLGVAPRSSARFRGDIMLMDHAGRLLRNPRGESQTRGAFKLGDSLAASDAAAWRQIARAERGNFATDTGTWSFATVSADQLASQAGSPAPYKIPPVNSTGHVHWKVVTYQPARDSALTGVNSEWAMYAALLIVLVSIAAARLAVAQAQRQAVKDKLSLQEEAYAQQLGVLTRHLITLQDQSRRRLALELHDRTSPNLMAIAVNLETIAKAMPRGASVPLKNRLADTRALLEDTTAAVREITAELRPALLDYAGLPAALDQLARQFTRRTRIAVDIVTAEFNARCGHSAQTCLYYIAQEALTNCAKHACANSVRIEARCADTLVTMTIDDDGAGFDPRALNEPSRKPGLGLLTMAERAKAAGGSIEIRSQPGRGTTIRVNIPHDAAAHSGDEIVATGRAGSGQKAI